MVTRKPIITRDRTTSPRSRLACAAYHEAGHRLCAPCRHLNAAQVRSESETAPCARRFTHLSKVTPKSSRYLQMSRHMPIVR
jgi:hypothetical protein